MLHILHFFFGTFLHIQTIFKISKILNFLNKFWFLYFPIEIQVPRIIASGSFDKSVKLWNAKTG